VRARCGAIGRRSAASSGAMLGGMEVVSATSTKMSGSSVSAGWKNAKQRRSAGSRRSCRSCHLVHRFVADHLLEDVRGRGPVDAADLEEAAVEPRREQVHEIVVDRGEPGMLVQRGEHILAHVHHAGGAAGREVQAPDELLARRLGGGEEVGDGSRSGIGAIALDRAVEAHRVGPEALGEDFQEYEPLGRVEPGVRIEDLARQGHAGSLSPLGEESLRHVAQLVRARHRRRAMDRLPGRCEYGFGLVLCIH
jgi:hypothetical protein